MTVTAYEISASPECGAQADILSRELGSRTGLKPSKGFCFTLTYSAALPKEGYRLAFSQSGVEISGANRRGLLYGVGALLRAARLYKGRIELPSGGEPVCGSPALPLRGHQLGYRPKTNAYDAWTPGIYRRYIEDLALFGANSIELVPPRTDDDETGPLLAFDPLYMLGEVSRVCGELDLDVWLWYPNIGGPETWYTPSGGDTEFMKPGNFEANLAEREAVFAAMPRLDDLLIPGGDPGCLSAADLFSFSEAEAALLRRYHPNAKIWLAPQAFNPTAEWLDTFFARVNAGPDWLGGLVFAPWEKYTLDELIAKSPAGLPIRLYPDITHSFHCQYPVPEWDTAFAMTLGRECPNPRPEAMKRIHNASLRPSVVGTLTYSEGVNDDLNKFVITGQDWDPASPVEKTVREYARFFISPELEDGFTEGVFALERNLAGSLAENDGVERTLAIWHGLEAEASEGVLANWRFEQPLLRACHDAYVRGRLIAETKSFNAAVAALRAGADAAEAEAILNACAVPRPELRERCMELADSLYNHIGAQLTTSRHHALNTERGAFLDNIDLPLTDAPLLRDVFRLNPGREAILSLLSRRERAAAYVSFGMGEGQSTKELVRPEGFESDYGFLASPLISHSPIIRYSPRPEELRSALDELMPGLNVAPLSWVSRAAIYYAAPLEARIGGLDGEKRYRVTVFGIWEGFRLTAAGTVRDAGAPGWRGPVFCFNIEGGELDGGTLALRWDKYDDGEAPEICSVLVEEIAE